MRDDELRDQRPLKPLPARRLAATVGGALVLLVLVVVASRGDRPSGTLDTGGRTTSLVLLNAALLVVAILVAVLVAFALYAFNPGRSGKPQPRTGSKLLAQLMLLILLAGFAFAVVTFIRDGRGEGARTQSGAQTLANFLSYLAGKRTTPSGEGIDWLPILLVFCATLAAILAAGVRIMRRTDLPEPDALLNARLAAVFDETLHDLRAERDPRRAVIAAYARMEVILGRHGLERRPAEAPARVRVPGARGARGERLGGTAADGLLRARQVQRPRDRRGDEGRRDPRARDDPRRTAGERGRPLRRGGAMRRRLLAVGAAAVAAAVVLVVVLAAVPERRALALQVYAFGLCAIVLLWLLGRTGAARDEGSAFDHARRVEPPDDEAVIDLARVEREVTLGVANAYDLHYRLRPRIRAIVTSRLADRRGIDLERQPEARAGRRRAGGLGPRPPRPAAPARPARAGPRAAAPTRGDGGS